MSDIKDIYVSIREQVFDALDAAAIDSLSKEELTTQLTEGVNILIEQSEYVLPHVVKVGMVSSFVDELTGLGPLQRLMEDDEIADIMINGPDNVFIEKNGKVSKSDVRFLDEAQLISIAKRIASRVGRRVDESEPLCDARLMDGSRVNIVIPPVAIDGTSMSIRKFKKQTITLHDLVGFGALSMEMAQVLTIAARCRLNILISGGTGSGKTTMLNALSAFISDSERIVTIEDAAELQILQPHVVRLETKNAGLEGNGAISARELVINALRMRPDRIIVGECRGGEAFEMLQAMNTGHDGSMSTLHANTPRDAVARVESMVMMGTATLPLEAIRRTIVSSVDLIVQIRRLHDGSRKVMSIAEVIGLEGSSVVLEEIFTFEAGYSEDSNKVVGEFVTPGLMKRSVLFEKARFFGVTDILEGIFSQ
ncbi:CpaF family protein [Moritella viscosa]|uniref:TadA n=1 Tax=Moritella viscosa TaxID=80854 RepID=A0A090IMS4_9GAMM|nr:CpaF family protein [Moritella viscosa]CED61789.1 type II/IV secretion system protein, ATP binding domain [Moritella viscosa]SGY90812.1 TadA [Moritella viscosa]SGY99753.1 TadA [Moritella viscosa]SGZ00375.1 TadA [Moritella viscosa]SHO05971.1 TadA [Moritella viscosa]